MGKEGLIYCFKICVWCSIVYSNVTKNASILYDKIFFLSKMVVIDYLLRKMIFII